MFTKPATKLVTLRIGLPVSTFHKGYKIQNTEEVFEILANPTLNPPSYDINDRSGQIIEGHFFEPELVLFRYS